MRVNTYIPDYQQITDNARIIRIAVRLGKKQGEIGFLKMSR
ncbi:MAG: hypothetical protein ABIB93_00135 [Chloroflexota bacterium]